jgi:thymidylate synthase (FAD)
MDSRMAVTVLAQTPNPQMLAWMAAHQDYSENAVFHEFCKGEVPSEEECGRRVVKHLLAGGRGHFGPLEHASITFNVIGFPHDVLVQARTHRISSFDAQSQRYTGQRVCKVAKGELDVEDVFYLRPGLTNYRDRSGATYYYSTTEVAYHRVEILAAAKRYNELLEMGWAEEHARQLLPQCIRQHFVASFNMRSLMHFLTIRGKADAQFEIRLMTQLMLPHFEAWAPQIYGWFQSNQWQKGRLAP